MSISQLYRDVQMPIKRDPLAKGRKIGKKPGREISWIEHLVCGWEMGFAEGKAEGKAEAVLEMLKHRHVRVSPHVRGRVRASRDLLELHRWLIRAITVDSAKELFESPSTRGKRRSGAAPAHSTRPRARPRGELQLVSS